MYDVKLPKTLDKQLQEELLKQYIETKDKEIRDTLIVHNLRLVRYISDGFKEENNCLREREDLFGEGVLGLMNALESYDPEKGSWSNHAVTHIKATIRSFIRDKTKGYRVSAGVYEALYKIETFRREYWKHNKGTEPTIAEVARALGMKYHNVKELMGVDQKTTSLDINISEDGDGLTLGDTIEDPDANFEDNVIESVFISEFIEQVSQYLNEDELKALGLLMGLNGRQYQLKEVATILNTSDTYAAELKNKALRKIRRSAYAMQLQRELDDMTGWYKSPSYSNEKVTGGAIESPVERIVFEREKHRNRLMNGEE